MKHLWLTALFVLALALPGSAAWAQNSPATSYQGNYYNVGAPAPLQQTDIFQASAVTCNQPPLTPNASTVNPTTFIWDDVVNGTVQSPKTCRFTVSAGGSLLSLPVGGYEASLTAVNVLGRAESARAPFSRVAPPAAPTGVKVVQP